MTCRRTSVILALLTASISQAAPPAAGRIGPIRAPVSLTFDQRLSASNGRDGEDFGFATAIDGGTAVIGALEANHVAGAVYVFSKTNDVWTEVQELTSDDAQPNDAFGAIVAISGDTIVVGAPGASADGHLKNGALYVFTRDAGVWSQTQKLLESDSADVDYWPFCLSMSGDTIVAGSANKNDLHGAAYVFTSADGVWSETQILTVEEEGRQYLGESCAVDGDNLLVGGSGSGQFQGAVYPYKRSAGTWLPELKFSASDGAPNDFFGWSVAMSGDAAVVGAVGADAGRGAAWIFSRSDNGWAQVGRLNPDREDISSFGSTVALHGVALAEVGAQLWNHTDFADFVFAPTGSAWEQTDALILAGTLGNHVSGMSLASDGETTLIGVAAAPDPNHPTWLPGAAYLYSTVDEALFHDGFDGGQ